MAVERMKKTKAQLIPLTDNISITLVLLQVALVLSESKIRD